MSHSLFLSPPLAAPATPPQAAPGVVIDSVVRAAQAGDAEAFTALYDAHVGRLYALCVGMTGSRAAADALVQDTFVRAWQRLSTFRGDSAFATWLHRVAVNELLSESRAAKRRTLRVAIAADLGIADGPVALPDAATIPEDTPLRLDLEQAIAKLPAGARAVFVLHDIGGYAHAEIAAQLGIAEGTSKAHLFRARRLLRGMIER